MNIYQNDYCRACGTKIPYSSTIEMADLDARSVKITVNAPERNMQEDDACFEALAIALMAVAHVERVVIGYASPRCIWTIAFTRVNGFGHYLRFLYRLWRFCEIYPWAEVDASCRDEVARFRAQVLGSGKLTNNVPDGQSSVNYASDGGGYSEHLYEKWFLSQPGRDALNRALQSKLGPFALTEVHDQLPNGLFLDEVKEENRIFPTGYFDLWGITESGDVCLFELKKDEGNEKLGIISELFFYTMYLRDFILEGLPCASAKKVRINHRGYKSLLELVQDGEKHKIYACFLVGNTHSLLTADVRKKVVELLNQNDLDIEYVFVEYDVDAAKAGIRQMIEDNG